MITLNMQRVRRDWGSPVSHHGQVDRKNRQHKQGHVRWRLSDNWRTYEKFTPRTYRYFWLTRDTTRCCWCWSGSINVDCEVLLTMRTSLLSLLVALLACTHVYGFAGFTPVFQSRVKVGWDEGKRSTITDNNNSLFVMIYRKWRRRGPFKRWQIDFDWKTFSNISCFALSLIEDRFRLELLSLLRYTTRRQRTSRKMGSSPMWDGCVLSYHFHKTIWWHCLFYHLKRCG
jgi:hypothetical protein